MEEERKGITEKYNAKCADYDLLETELSRVKEALKDAQDIIDIQESVRKEAKESQVKCCALEEQIEVSVLKGISLYDRFIAICMFLEAHHVRLI